MAEIFGVITAALGTLDILVSRIEKVAERCKASAQNPNRWSTVTTDYQSFRNTLFQLQSKLRSSHSIQDDKKSEMLVYLEYIERGFSEADKQLNDLEVRLAATTKSDSVPPKQHTIKNQLAKAFTKKKKSMQASSHAVADSNTLDKLEETIASANSTMATISAFVHMVEQIAEIGRSIPSVPNLHDEFQRHFAKPLLPKTAFFDFITTNENGAYISHEAELKRMLLSHANISNQITNASEPQSLWKIPVSVCAYGQGGMGKSLTLRYLCHDEDVRRQFKDGIYFVAVGENASSYDIITSMSRLANQAGFLKTAAKIENAKNVEDAANQLSPVFHEKAVLIVVDNLWPTDNCSVGHLFSFQAITSQTDSSALLTSTRDPGIACSCTDSLLFSTLEHLGSNATGILLQQLNMKMSDLSLKQNDSKEALDDILEICGGIKLCLAIAGAGISEELQDDDDDDLERTLVQYRNSLVKRRDRLIHSRPCDMYHNTIQGIVLESLDRCEAWTRSTDLLRETGEELKFHTLFSGLCIVEKQKGIPLSAVARVWEMSTELTNEVLKTLQRVDLIDRHVRVHINDANGTQWVETIIEMHDLLIDVARCMTRNNIGTAEWHRRFISTYLPDMSNRFDGIVLNPNLDEDDSLITIAEPKLADALGNPRWWKLNEKEKPYFVNNICRHLQGGKLFQELWNLLTTVEWTLQRRDTGGWLGLEADFAKGITAFSKSNTHTTDFISGSTGFTKDGLEKLQLALFDGWGDIHDDQHTVGFAILGRITNYGKDTGLERYIASVGRFGPAPWLCPLENVFESDQRQVARFYFTSDPIADITCTDDILAWIAVENHQVFVYSIAERRVIQQVTVGFNDHYNPLCCVSPNGSLLTQGCFPRTDRLILWSSKTDQVLPDTPQFDMSTDSSHSASAFSWTGNLLAISFLNNRTSVYDVVQPTPVLLYSFTHRITLTWVSFSANDRFLAGYSSQCVYVWDVSDLSTISHVPTILDIPEDNGSPTCMTIDESGNKLAVGCMHGIYIWNLRTREYPLCMTSHGIRTVCVRFSEHCEFLVSGNEYGHVIVWSLRTGIPLEEPFKGHCKPIVALHFSDDCRSVISTSSDRTIRKWNIRNPVHASVSHGSGALYVTCATISEDANMIVSGLENGSLRIENISKGKHVVAETSLAHQLEITMVTLSLDGKRIASYARDHFIRVWNIGATLELSHDRVIESWESELTAIMLTPDGQKLISGHDEGEVMISNLGSEKSVKINRLLIGHEYQIKSFASNYNGKTKTIASIDTQGWLRIWDMETLKLVGKPVRTNKSTSIKFSENGQWIVSACSMIVQVWDLKNSRQIGSNLELNHLEQRYDSWCEELVSMMINDDRERKSTRSLLENNVAIVLEKSGYVVHSRAVISGNVENISCNGNCQRFNKTHVFRINALGAFIDVQDGTAITTIAKFPWVKHVPEFGYLPFLAVKDDVLIRKNVVLKRDVNRYKLHVFRIKEHAEQ